MSKKTASMSKRDVAVATENTIEFARLVVEYAHGLTKATLMAEGMRCHAILRNLESIGEVATRAHGCLGNALETVSHILDQQLPDLLGTLQELPAAAATSATSATSARADRPGRRCV